MLLLPGHACFRLPFLYVLLDGDDIECITRTLVVEEPNTVTYRKFYFNRCLKSKVFPNGISEGLSSN